MDFCKTTQMLFILLGVACFTLPSAAFRGPHHPNSHVSHKHAQPQKDASFTLNSEIIHDIEHLKEDLGKFADKIDFSNLPSDSNQLDFFYFQVHDSDNNSKLDGLEMLQALQHIYAEEEEDHEIGASIEPEEIESRLNYMTEIVDAALKEHDLNGDGYLGYAEFKMSRNQGLL